MLLLLILRRAESFITSTLLPIPDHHPGHFSPPELSATRHPTPQSLPDPSSTLAPEVELSAAGSRWVLPNGWSPQTLTQSMCGGRRCYRRGSQSEPTAPRTETQELEMLLMVGSEAEHVQVGPGMMVPPHLFTSHLHTCSPLPGTVAVPGL